MTFGHFEIGQLYNRRRDIHENFGGQQQGGISTPSRHPVIFAFTGDSGAHHGYADGWVSDVYRYFGEGQEGPMRWKGGNTSIRDHSARGKDLLLFQTTSKKGFARFLGEFICAGYQIQTAPDRLGEKRDAIVLI